MATTLKAERYANPSLALGRNRIFVELAAQGRRILECGCSTGYLSRHLAERGCTVTGIEIDADAAEQARQWCERVLVTDLNNLEWMNGLARDYDTILFGDVLEHLVHPEIVLRKASELLAPGGRVIVCLPNIAHWRIRASLLMGRFEYTPTGIMDVTHLRFFTPKSARKFIEDSGYDVISTHLIVGGGRIGGHIRRLLPGLFTRQMIFVARLSQPSKG